MWFLSGFGKERGQIMKIEKSAMSESEWIRFQSLEISRKNVNEGLGLLLMFIAGILLLAVVFNVNIPILLVGVLTVVIFCFKQLKNMFENGRSYFVHRESENNKSEINITSPVFERDSLESNDIPVIASPSSSEKLEDIIVMDEEVERVKGNRGVSVNSEDNALEDIQTLESSFAEIPVIDCEDSAIVFDETFSPNPEDL